jgi:uncharacterized integral membrane protein (TIGR00698 family)
LELSVRLPQWLPAAPDLPGVGLSAALGLVAVGLAHALPPSPFVSDVLIALLLGVLVLNVPVLRTAVGLALPSPEREPDRYASGLRFTGKWVLRLGIVLMGLKLQTNFFGANELELMVGVALAAIPSAFFVAHALGALFGLRRPLVDLLAGGTMICGASAVNAIAPVARAHRDEQGLAIATVFLFSVVALLTFRPIAALMGLDPGLAGIWSGLAVNDLSSAVAVGAQMGGNGAVMAAAAKSTRVLLLAPTLVSLALLRREGAPVNVQKSIVESFPGFLLGYIGLAAVRFSGDRLFGDGAQWTGLLASNRLMVDVLLSTVAAGIGLHLSIPRLVSSSPRAVAVAGGTSMYMAGITLAMIVVASRSSGPSSALVGLGALATTFVLYRASTAAESELRRLRQRFEQGAPLSLGEATTLLEGIDHETGSMDEALLRRVLVQLHPTIGELIPVRSSPLPKGEGCRWVAYWEGQRSGWALVAMCREPGSFTPIHAHPHRLLGKAIEGVIEELRFAEHSATDVEVQSRAVLGHDELVQTDGLATLHVVRVVGRGTAIDLQLRGPEVGCPGRRLRTLAPVDFATLTVGTHLAVEEEIDDRPGHGGEGAAAGRVSA